MRLIPYPIMTERFLGTPDNESYATWATTDKSDFEKITKSDIVSYYALQYWRRTLIHDEAMPDLPTITDYFHEEVVEHFKKYYNDSWKNNFFGSLLQNTYVSNDKENYLEEIQNLSLDNAYVRYKVVQDTGTPRLFYLTYDYIIFFDENNNITPKPKQNVTQGLIKKGKTNFFNIRYTKSVDNISRPLFDPPETPDYRLFNCSEEDMHKIIDWRTYGYGSNVDEIGIFYDKNLGQVISLDFPGYESETGDCYCKLNFDDIYPRGISYYHNNPSNYEDISFAVTGFGAANLIGLPNNLPSPVLPGLDAVDISISPSVPSCWHYGFIKLSDYSFVNLIEKNHDEFLWSLTDAGLHKTSSYGTISLFKGECAFEVDPAQWTILPNTDCGTSFGLRDEKWKIENLHLTEKDEIVFDLEMEDTTYNYKAENYEIKNGVAKNVHQKMLPIPSESTETWRMYIPRPFWKYSDIKKGFTITINQIPNHLVYEGTMPIVYNGHLIWYSFAGPTYIVRHTDNITYGRLIFTLKLTGMGNDPCKQCCACDIDTEEKKYKTIIDFTADEPLQGRVMISPQDLEYEWQENSLILMLSEGETVIVDNIPTGVKYEISVETEDYDECDNNEFVIDNSSGTIGDDPEGETNVSVNVQNGETVQQYLDRLRQRGYEKLAETLKLENVEFTLQDERIKLGDLVTVDLPEFDFKAVVRVTGVKIKSQGNQTIRTISVGTPLKILRRSKI